MNPKLPTQLMLSLLALSLAGNGVLLWRDRGIQAAHAPAAQANRPRTSPAPEPSSVAIATRVANSLNWDSLAPDDVKQFAAGLQSAGISPELARVIVQARLAEDVTLRRAALAPEATSSPYWKLPEVNTKLTVENAAALRKAARDNAKLVESVFGPDEAAHSPQDIRTAAQFGPIPADKVEQLRMIDDDYRDLALIYSAEARLAALPEDRERMAFLQRERLKDIQAALTPEEHHEYQLRNSNVALGLRNTLEAFEPTEAEFKAIFALQQAFADQFPNATSAAEAVAMQATAPQRMQAQQQLTAQIRATLGPERAADYDKGTDFNYRNSVRVAQQLNLPRQAADQVYDLQKDIQARAQALRTNRELTPDARNQQLQALQTEATTRLTQALGGQRGMDVYRQQTGAAWIQNMVPPAPGGRGAAAPAVRVAP